MKFLCLYGGGTSEQLFKDQLEPLRANLPARFEAQFQYVAPLHQIPDVPEDLMQYAGAGPYLRYVEYPQQASVPGLVRKMGEISGEGTSEQAWRNAFDWFYPQVLDEQSRFKKSIRRSVEYLEDCVRKLGPFDGLIGYCEGASIGAALISDRLARGLDNPFKCALFYNGYAPYLSDGSKFVLADDVGAIFNFPTCHVIGSDDPMIEGCKTLLNLCDSSKAIVIEGGAGHLMPQDRISTNAVLTGFCTMVEAAVPI
ncbi:hypothetical protein N7465_005781 [Penicillium sp. CMV-2018d]|nr:hypothetical protein N7465_005781 [Penicillium sp. CMV-2018d]